MIKNEPPQIQFDHKLKPKPMMHQFMSDVYFYQNVDASTEATHVTHSNVKLASSRSRILAVRELFIKTALKLKVVVGVLRSFRGGKSLAKLFPTKFSN